MPVSWQVWFLSRTARVSEDVQSLITRSGFLKFLKENNLKNMRRCLHTHYCWDVILCPSAHHRVLALTLSLREPVRRVGSIQHTLSLRVLVLTFSSASFSFGVLYSDKQSALSDFCSNERWTPVPRHFMFMRSVSAGVMTFYVLHFNIVCYFPSDSEQSLYRED